MLALGYWLLLIYKGDTSNKLVINRTITLVLEITDNYIYISCSTVIFFFRFIFLLIKERIAKSHGSQCGFCTPGIVMSMYTVLRNNLVPTQKEIESAFEGMKLLS